MHTVGCDHHRLDRSGTDIHSDEEARTTRKIAAWVGIIGHHPSSLSGQPSQLGAAIHQIGDVQNEVGGRADDAMTARNWIKRTAQRWVPEGIVLDFCKQYSSGSERSIELRARFDAGLAQSHLHAAMSVALPLSRVSKGEKNHPRKAFAPSRLSPVGLGGRHPPKGF